MVRVDVWLDLLDPRSYLGLRAFRRALASTAESGQVGDPPLVQIRPLLGLTELPLKADVATDVEKQAGAVGILLEEGVLRQTKGPDTVAAQKLIAFAGELDPAPGPDALQPKVAEALLRVRFEMGLNLADPEVLVGVGQDFGIAGEATAEALANAGLGEMVHQEFNIGLHLGITKSPTFIFDETTFVEGVQTEEAFERIVEAALENTENTAENTAGSDAGETADGGTVRTNGWMGEQ